MGVVSPVHRGGCCCSHTAWGPEPPPLCPADLASAQRFLALASCPPPPPPLLPFPGSESRHLPSASTAPDSPYISLQVSAHPLLALYNPQVFPVSAASSAVKTTLLWGWKWSSVGLPIEQRALEGRHPCTTGSGTRPGSEQIFKMCLLND